MSIVSPLPPEVQEQWIHSQLLARQDEYTKSEALKLWLGTWNVNGKHSGESLREWLQDDEHSDGFDIYFLGFQELDLTAGALLLGDETRAAPWIRQIEETLTDSGEYELVHSKQLVGMLLCMFARKSLAPHIEEVCSDARGVGILGVMGNKGGVAIRFRLYGSTICVVNSHLNAHMDNVKRRNQDFSDIKKQLRFEVLESADRANVTRRAANNELNSSQRGSMPSGGGGGGGGGQKRSLTIFDHDYLFWIGDLNYRIEMDDETVRRFVTEERWSELFENDQLRWQMESGAAFGLRDGWQEAALLFAPSYKYDTQSTQYDTSEKHRTPAWCDRVLFCHLHGDDEQQLFYRRAELLTSDHRPVSAAFRLMMRVEVADKKEALVREMVTELDNIENELLPDCALSESQWAFGNISYRTRLTKTVRLSNTGQVAAQFRFVPKLEESSVFPAWASVEPSSGFLMPKEHVDLELRVMVDARVAAAAELDLSVEQRLDEILLLELHNGKHFFVALSGTYLPSMFGVDLRELCRHAAPFRHASPLPEQEASLPIPKELWCIVDYIFRHGLDEEGLFVTGGDTEEIAAIQEWLNTHCDMTGFEEAHADVGVHSMAETLVRFLDSLPEPVVCAEHYAQALSVCGDRERCEELLSYLPVEHYNVFYYLIAFLREVLRHREENQLSAELLAALFGSVLLRAAGDVHADDDADALRNDMEEAERSRRRAEFVMGFLRA